MGLNHAGPIMVPNVSVTNPMAPLAVPQPAHAVDALSRPMSAALGAQDVPSHSPGFFAPSPFGPSPPNWSNSAFQAATSNRQLFIGNVCVLLFRLTVVDRTTAPFSMPMARPQRFVSYCGANLARRRRFGA